LLERRGVLTHLTYRGATVKDARGEVRFWGKRRVCPDNLESENHELGKDQEDLDEAPLSKKIQERRKGRGIQEGRRKAVALPE